MPDNEIGLVQPTPPVRKPSRWKRFAQMMGAILLCVVLGTSAVVFTVAAADLGALVLDTMHAVVTAHYCVLPGGR